MVNWNFLLLVIFLVPRCHCETLSVNKTGLLLKELDDLLVKATQEHVEKYASRRECLASPHAEEENLRFEQNGIILLQNVLERYYLLTQFYNSGCKKQENVNLSGQSSICEPFGCHKIEIRSGSDPLFSKDSSNTLRSKNVNVNNIKIVLNLPESLQNFTEILKEKLTEKVKEELQNKKKGKPTEEPKGESTEELTEEALKEPKKKRSETPTEEEEEPKKGGIPVWKRVAKWVPIINSWV